MKYTGDFKYKGELVRVKGGQYEYTLNGKTYHVVSKPWVNRAYGHWETRSHGNYASANFMWMVIRDIDRSNV